VGKVPSAQSNGGWSVLLKDPPRRKPEVSVSEKIRVKEFESENTDS